jgi:hypothetical protein
MVVKASQCRIEAVRPPSRLLQRRLVEVDLDPDSTSRPLCRSLAQPGQMWSSGGHSGTLSKAF